LDDAFASAVEEEGLGEFFDDEPFLPNGDSELTAADEQADALGDDEQPEVDTDAGDELLDLLVEEGDDDAEDEGDDTYEVGSDEFWGETVEVDFGDGPEEVTLEELLAGTMKGRDYTQKTQVLAEQREANEKAISFYDTFLSDPKGVLNYLIEQVGGVEELAAGGNVAVEFGGLSPEEMEEEVARRVEERLEDDPSIEAARTATAVAAMENQFVEIEDDFNTELSLDNKSLILETARERGTPDLYAVYTVLRAQADRIREERSGVRRGSTSRREGGSLPTDEAITEPVTGVSDAYNRAMRELGLR
jgi:hypothetical protein